MHLDFYGDTGRITAVPSHFARQLAAASRLAPAEAYRGHSALLISCGEPSELPRAEEALADRWGLDAVHRLSLPVRSWSEVLRESPGADSWIQAYVLRALDRHDPSLIAIVDDAEPAPGVEDASAGALPAALHGWGATLPVAVLRIRPDSDVEWVVAPALSFRTCG